MQQPQNGNEKAADSERLFADIEHIVRRAEQIQKLGRYELYHSHHHKRDYKRDNKGKPDDLFHTVRVSGAEVVGKDRYRAVVHSVKRHIAEALAFCRRRNKTVAVCCT